MKFYLIFILIFALKPSYSVELKTYTIGQQEVTFIIDRSKKLMISQGCIELKCDAYRSLTKVSFKKIEHLLGGGAKPGALICVYGIEKELVFGTSKFLLYVLKMRILT